MIKKFKPFHAPIRYYFVDPDTGHEYRALSDSTLAQQILSYRAQNNLPPIQNLSHVLENYWCSLPENTGSCEPVQLTRGWMQYIKGGVALLEYVFYGPKGMVPDEEASRRAGICISCPANVFPDPDNVSSFITWSDEVATHCTHGRSIPEASQLGNCQICSCLLKAKVFKKPPFGLSEAERKEMKEVNPKCWQVT